MPSKPGKIERPWIRRAERRVYETTATEVEVQESQKFYQSMAWRNLRNLYIKKHPLCVVCLKRGHYVPGYVVDHVQPIRQGGAKLSESNLQTLCEKCHNRKRAAEKGQTSYSR